RRQGGGRSALNSCSEWYPSSLHRVIGRAVPAATRRPWGALCLASVMQRLFTREPDQGTINPISLAAQSPVARQAGAGKKRYIRPHKMVATGVNCGTESRSSDG